MSRVPVPAANDQALLLVADDDKDVRTMLRTLPETDGHEVLEAKDGDEAWRMCMELQRAVVVADIQMTGIDGLELCRRIRKSKSSPEIKVIVYTAGMATPEPAKNAGCDEYFLKTDPSPGCGIRSASTPAAVPANRCATLREGDQRLLVANSA